MLLRNERLFFRFTKKVLNCENAEFSSRSGFCFDIFFFPLLSSCRCSAQSFFTRAAEKRFQQARQRDKSARDKEQREMLTM
jgi:hypothetical protein